MSNDDEPIKLHDDGTVVEEITEPDLSESTVTIIANGNGYSSSVGSNINPITLAGMGWYLIQLAEMGLSNMLMLQAQAEQKALAKQPGLLVPMKGHLDKGGKPRLS